MSYYVPQAGDYATYGYGGDPGFFSKLWKTIKKVVPVVGGFIAGGPVGAIAAYGGTRAGGKTFPGGAPQWGTPGLNVQAMAPGVGRFPVPWGGMPKMPKGRIPVPIPIPFNGGGANGLCCPPGWHPIKDGTGRCVRNRTMNICNPKALRRAIRREKGFGKLASRMGYSKRSSRRRSTAKCA